MVIEDGNGDELPFYTSIWLQVIGKAPKAQELDQDTKVQVEKSDEIGMAVRMFYKIQERVLTSLLRSSLLWMRASVSERKIA